jgi:protein ImuA
MISSAPDPAALHPSLWRAHQLGRAAESVVPTGFVALDAQLPGGGWPCGALTELLLPSPGVGEMRLLAPGLASAVASGRPVMLFDPPARPCAQALAQLHIDTRQLIVVHGREGPAGAGVRPRLSAADLLWALEQTLRSGSAGPVLVWLPDVLRADALRRLHLASLAHPGPAFLLRGVPARLKPSPAALRLMLHPAGVPDELSVQVLKRRGPPLAQPLRLALAPVLTRSQQTRARSLLRPPVPARPGDRLALGTPG